MKTIAGFILFYSFICHACPAQVKEGNRKGNDCVILETVINDSLVKKFFYLETRKDLPIVLYDNSNLFPQCHSLTFDKNELQVVHDEAKYRTNALGTSLVIVSVKKEDQIFTVNLYDPALGGNATVLLKMKRNKYIVDKRELHIALDEFHEEK